MIRSNLLALATFVVTAAVAQAPLAQAQEARTSKQMVGYADLDLTTEAGAAALRHRIDIAVKQVCGPAEMLGSPDYSSYAQCLDQASTDARRRATLMIASAREAHYASVAPSR